MGGVEVYLEALAKVLSSEADVYALCVLDELAQKLSACGVHVVRVPAFRKLRLLRFFWAVVATVYLLLRYRIQVVQINGLLESILLLPARLLGRKTLYTRHGPFELDLYSWYRQPHKYLPRFFARYGAHLASRLVCVSETVGSLCAPQFPAHQLAVIPNWVSSLPVPRVLPVAAPSRPLQILCVGRLEQYKGVQLLLEAVRDLPEVNVTVVGDGSYRAQLELQAPSNVTFAGFHRDTAMFYRSADIFVMPSYGPEGLPMVALEAMSHSLACIFSNLPVHAEITENGNAALLFERGNATQLRCCLERLAADHTLRHRMARNAYQLIASKYHESVAGKAYLQLFHSLAGTQTRQPVTA